MDVVSGLSTLKVFGRANAQPDRVKVVNDDYRRTTMGTLRLAFLSSLVLDVLSMIAVALVAVGVGLRLAGGDMGFETALFVLILVPEAFIPMRALGANFHASADGLAAMDAVERILNEPLPTATAGAALAEGALVVTDLEVRHPGRPHPAPDGFVARVDPGEFVAIVGPSGVGKSTLFAVLLGFATPDAGTVTIGGVDQRLVDPTEWRRQFAWLPQDPYLMRGTVAANIGLGQPNASPEQIADAAQRAALDLPLDRVVDDGGVGLSAGQRRRVGLARALLRDAPYLLLDEPTAGLDPETEARVLETLRTGPATVIAIAHRPATIAAASRVIEMTAPALVAPTPVGASA
jgi:ATP-binding cassette subfamily C protein CydD